MLKLPNLPVPNLLVPKLMLAALMLPSVLALNPLATRPDRAVMSSCPRNVQSKHRGEHIPVSHCGTRVP